MLVGTPQEMIHDLQRRRERWGFSYIVISQCTDLDAIAPVVSELHGT